MLGGAWGVDVLLKISRALIAALATVSLALSAVSPALASGFTFSIVDSSGVSIVHRTAVVGSSLVFDLSSDTTIDSASAESSDHSVALASISGNVLSVSLRSEGFSKVTVTAVAGGTSFSRDLWIGAYSALPHGPNSVINSQTSYLYAPTTDAGSRGNSSVGQSAVVIGEAGAYYRIVIDDSTVYSDGNSTTGSFVAKSAIDVPVTSVDVTTGATSIEVGSSTTAAANQSPDYANDVASATWSSSDPAIASVSSDGTIRGKKAGSVTITRAVASGHGLVVSDSVSLTVRDVAVTAVKLTSTSQYLLRGKSLRLASSVTPNNATDKTVSYTSSNTTVATVSSSGLVVGKKLGVVRIIATSNNGKRAELVITVVLSIPSTPVPPEPATSTSQVSLGLQASTKSRSAIRLAWGSGLKNVSSYVVYVRSAGSSKLLLKKKLSASKFSLVIRSLNKGTVYKFQVRAVSKSNRTIAKSKVVTAKTWTSLRQAHKNAEKKIKKILGSMLLSSHESSLGPVKISGNNLVYPYVKYRWTGSKLEINIFLKFHKGSAIRPGDESFSKVKKLTIAGIAKYYTRSIHSAIDFGPNSKFSIYPVVYVKSGAKVSVWKDGKKTKVVKADAKQNYLLFRIGDKGDKWFFFSGITGFGVTGTTQNSIHLAATHAVPGSYRGSTISSIAAHEIGHALGLADSYASNRKIDVFAQNSETAIRNNSAAAQCVNNNLMCYQYTLSSLLPNDLQMMLVAYREQLSHASEGFQNYNFYRDPISGEYKKISQAISNCKDFDLAKMSASRGKGYVKCLR